MDSPAPTPHVVIIGAGQAAAAAAASLRQFGWRDAITMVGDEGCLPYQRPPLSKAWLKGELADTGLLLRPAKFYVDQNIQLRLNARAVRIDRARRSVMLQDGIELRYSHLIAATGARCNLLPDDQGLDGILYLRTREHADRIRQALVPGTTLVVIGGGYVGLEVAATAQQLGLQVVVIEREQRLLARVASAPFAAFMADTFQSKGVRIELNASLASLEVDHGRIQGVVLSSGEQIACQALLVGIGARANDELLREAGLACNNGVIVDHDTRTSDPAIFAAGDCTHRPLPFCDGSGRLESVPNAIEQAKQAAAAICGRAQPKPEVPWFWSDQFDLRIQIAGLRDGAVTEKVRRSDDGRSFCVHHFDQNNRLRAVEAINAASEFMAGKRLIAEGRTMQGNGVGHSSAAVQETAA